MKITPGCLTRLTRLLAVSTLLLAAGAAPLRAQCPPPGMSETITWPVDGATLPAGHLRVEVTRSGDALPFYWADNGPTLYVKQNFGTFNLVTTTLPGTMTPMGNGQYVWDFDATGQDPGNYVIQTLDFIYKQLPGGGVDPGYDCPAAGDYTAVSHFNLSGVPTERTLSSQTIGQMCLADRQKTRSDTSPLSGNQSWSVPITSWDYHGTTFGLALNYQSLSMVDPQTVDGTSPTPDEPLVPDYAGLSEKNDKWSDLYAQWVEVVHDESGAEYAVWHHGGGALPFKKNGAAFAPPDSFHSMTFGGSATGTYPCSGGSQNVTVPYGWFTITDGNGTQYLFNQPQPGTGTHLDWITGNCLAVPEYLLSRIQDRWGRGVNLTWSDVTVGSGMQKRCTAVKDDSGTGLTLAYANGLLQTVMDPQSRTHTLSYTAVPDETLPNPVNRMKLTRITVQGPGSPNRTTRAWTFVYSNDPATNTAAYGGTYTGDLVIQKTEPDGTSASYQYEAIFLDPSDHTRPRGQDWDGRVSAISWPDSSEGGQSVTYTITRTLNSATQATLTYPSSADLPLAVQQNYDSSGNLLSVTDLATGRVWSYTYDGMRNLLTVRSPLEQSGNPLVQYTPTLDASGHITQMVAQVRQDGGTLGDPVTTTYNLLNEPTLITSAARAGSGNVDQVTKLDYDNGAPIMVPGSPGELTKILTGYGTALQQETDLTYGGTPGAWGLPDTAKNAVGATSSFGYDPAAGRLTTATSPVNLLVPTTNADHAPSVMTLQYNSDGLPSVVQDPMGHQESIGYTAQTPGSGNLLITLTHLGDGSVRSLVLDPMGRIIQSTDENGVVTKWTYNPSGQVKTIERAVGLPEDRTSVFNYDCRGDLYRIAPPGGGAGRLLFMYLRYNQDGTLDKSKSPSGTYEGQVCRINYPDGSSEYFGYNDAGELAWHRKQDGTIVTIASRDALHRITQVSYPASQGNAAFSVSTAYDEFGRVTSATDSAGTTLAVYDVLNRLTSLTPPAPQKALTYSYAPDTVNQRWSTTVSVAGVGNYLYQADTKGRLAAVTNPFNRPFTLQYDPDGKNTVVAYPNGEQEQRMYTPRDWLSMLQVGNPTGTLVDTFSYLYYDAQGHYDPTGHLRQEVDAGSRAHVFSYDNLYQLTQETHPDFGTIGYGYDLNGNRTSKTTSAGTDYYGVDAANKLLWVNRGTNAVPTSGQVNPYTLFGYDLNGNVTSRERRDDSGLLRSYSFSWDGDNRLRSVNEGATNRFTATYDGSGTRISKTDSWTGAHNYSWGPGGLVYDSAGPTTYTPGLSQQAGGVDRYPLHDWLGSTRYLTDGSQGVDSALRFDAYGNRSLTGGTDPYDPSDFQFGAAWGYQTEYANGVAEPGLGLQLLGERYYDPAVGRFISQDPIGLADYGYAGNDPVNAVDPSGLYSFHEFASDFLAGTQVVRAFGYNNRFILGPIAGVAAGTLSLDPFVGFATGSLVSGQLASAGDQDVSHVIADALAGGTGAGELGILAAQGSTALQYQFSTEEAEGLGCPDGSVALSGSKGGEASSGPQAFEVGSYAELSAAARGLPMEAHKLPQAHLAEQVIPGYTRRGGLAILLPEQLHWDLPRSSRLTGDLTGLTNHEIRAAVSQQIRDLFEGGVPRSALTELGLEMRARYGSSRLYAK